MKSVALKRRLASAHPQDRVEYTQGKAGLIRRVTTQAKTCYKDSFQPSRAAQNNKEWHQ